MIRKEYILKPFSVWLFLDTPRGKKIGMKFKNSLNQITKRKKWQLTEKHYIYRIYKCDNFSQRQPRFGRENKGPVIIEGGFIAWRLSCISKAFLWFSCFTHAAGFWGTRKYSGSRDTARSRRQQQLSWYSDKVGPKIFILFLFLYLEPASGREFLTGEWVWRRLRRFFTDTPFIWSWRHEPQNLPWIGLLTAVGVTASLLSFQEVSLRFLGPQELA